MFHLPLQGQLFSDHEYIPSQLTINNRQASSAHHTRETQDPAAQDPAAAVPEEASNDLAIEADDYLVDNQWLSSSFEDFNALSQRLE